MSTNEPKKRLKAAESRRALLDAGLDLLKSRGIAPGLDRVTLKDAIEISGVPRSTAYRLYEGGSGQLEAFRADLLADLDSQVDMGPTIAAVSRTLLDNEPAIETGDGTKMAAALREVIRVGLQANVEAVADSVEWRVFMTSLAGLGTGMSLEPTDEDLFRSTTAEFGDRFVPLMDEVASIFGIRVREPMTINEFGSLVSATIEGVALRQNVDPRLSNLKRPTGPNGELQVWNAAAVAFESMVLAWFEPNPDAPASADLSSWTSF